MRNSVCPFVAFLLVAVFSVGSVRADVVIDDPLDFYTTGIGDYAAAGGSATVATAFGKIAELLVWDSTNDTETLLPAAPQTIGALVASISGTDPITMLVFGIGINETGAAGSGNTVDVTQLNISFGTTTFTLGSDTITIDNYQQGGQSESEAFVKVLLPFDLRTQPVADAFAITSTITGRDDGREVLFLTNQTVVVPEPSAFLCVGLVGLLVGGTKYRNWYFKS